jgi:hypothetical protein
MGKAKRAHHAEVGTALSRLCPPYALRVVLIMRLAEQLGEPLGVGFHQGVEVLRR